MPRRPRVSARAHSVVSVVATVTAALVVGALVVPSGPAGAATPAAVRSASAAALYGNGQYTSPTSEAARAAGALASSDPAGARAASTIARYPVATWLGEWTTGAALDRTLDTATAGAAANGTTAVFVTYAIPQRDCGGYSAGGFDETSYDAWIDRIVTKLAGKRAAVVVEPDSLAMLSNDRCTPTLDQQRYRILSREVAAFTAAGVPAYLDAGNSNWVPPTTMAARLRSAGVQDARGFFTNVANYYPVAQEQVYAEKLSALTGGSHYVIDTSRNGQGWRGTWCNAPGAGLGTSPRVIDDGTALDALLWVKTPGASDGTCNGGPAAGKWYSASAQVLVANAVLGAPQPVRSPVGTLDAASGAAAAVRVSGWAFDQDEADTALTVRVTVDGRVAGSGLADRARQDVGDTYGVGAAHGYDVTVPAAAGTRTVCVTAVNVSRGADERLGCDDVTVLGHDPVVRLTQAVVVPAGIRVQGVAVDGDAPGTALPVALVVDGRTVRTARADRVRSDLADLGVGTAHGFAAVVPAGAGRHTVCVRATNTGPGRDVTAPCSVVTVAASAPSGALETVVSSAHRRVDVAGHAFDREDMGAPVTIVVTVAGKQVGRFTADRVRADVDRSTGAGAAHGFTARVVGVTGRRSVCIRAVGIGAGGDRSLGCRTVTVR
ncbi:glycoside hydrolase family 6 protein [Curtobacterium sp. VKM Ac-1395]|uniref:glycoside hydrolase family 6 protein n=1 Tax=Curtobacterium sp. VKM Ac-1395 TaxID=2783815 RepID=UPI00188A1F01|nr:glycoside hydrolase family 6 protein [Curtobacterium sp. VKM Ac-1395]MBF4591189.1 glycoside hydrolase family 6 protein [Curtobacterium sp. VKM Ac-1395]